MIHRIGAVISIPQGACSYYRSIGAFSKIKDITFELLEKGNWVNYSSIDILYMERPVLPSFIEGMRMAKSFNIPVWIDFDDDLFNVPKYNPAHTFYSKKETLESIVTACKLADMITVTSVKLQKVYSQFNKNVEVIPNAWNDINFPLDTNIISNKKIVNWRGSATHRNDLLEYKESLLKSVETRKDWHWSWIGKEHWMISDFIDDKQKISIDEMDIIQFFNVMKQLNPAIQIVPLKINEFNEAKSNIAWLEATYAGAVTIAPPMEQWNRPGIIRYQDMDHIYDEIIDTMSNDKKRKAMWRDSYEYIESELLLSKINKKRSEIIEKLIN